MTEWRIWAYSEARPGAKKEAALTRDEVIDIYAALDTEGLLAHNPTWFLTKYGRAYSSWVQPVKQDLNPVERRVPQEGFWAQVTVPYVEMRSAPHDKAYRLYRLYYSSVHLVVDRVVDDFGEVWYQLKDDEYPSVKEYLRAEGLRRILPGELTAHLAAGQRQADRGESERSEVVCLRRRHAGCVNSLSPYRPRSASSTPA